MRGNKEICYVASRNRKELKYIVVLNLSKYRIIAEIIAENKPVLVIIEFMNINIRFCRFCSDSEALSSELL